MCRFRFAIISLVVLVLVLSGYWWFSRFDLQQDVILPYGAAETIRGLPEATQPDGSDTVFHKIPAGALMVNNSRGNNDVYYASDGRFHNLTEYSDCDNIEPTLSSNGLWIAYSSDCGNWPGQYEIWLYDLSTRANVPLTESGDAIAINPDWSPDGEYLAYASNVSGNYRLYTIRVSQISEVTMIQPQGDATSFLPNLHRFSPTWSPDGNQVAYVVYDQENDQYGLYSYNLYNQQEYDLVPLLDHELHDPDWHPDKDIIAFSGKFDSYQGFQDETLNIYYLFLKNDHVTYNKLHRRLEYAGFNQVNPRWARDGSMIFFQTLFASGRVDPHYMMADPENGALWVFGTSWGFNGMMEFPTNFK